MEKFLAKFNHSQASSSTNVNHSHLIDDLNLDSLKADPGKRVPIAHYNPRIKDEVRKHYIQKGPCQPKMDSYPPTEIGKRMCQFCKIWFEGPYSKWLEYSVEKDFVYCLCCYLFKDDFFHESTSEFYTKTGFRSWNRKLERFRKHVSDVNSIHDKCFNKMLDLSNHHQSIQVVIDKHRKLKNEYRMRLEASIDVSRLLLQYGLPFQGHGESESSTNQDIVNACAKETLKAIIGDLNGDYFGILVDESKDISHKEQMALVLRFVNKNGEVVERFIGLVHDLSSGDLLRDHQGKKLEQLFESGEVKKGQGLHQKRGLQRRGDTLWGSHFKTLDNFIVIFSSIVHVLEVIELEGSTSSDRNQAEYLLTKIKIFKFIFVLHLTLKVLAMSNELNQDIVNAVEFLNITKKRFQDMRENGWESLLDDVSSFCDVHDILIPKLDESYFPGKSKCKSPSVSYAHHLRVEVSFVVINVQLEELNIVLM
ncbi:hypothetical protein H5410_031322 [Solanum commersonii]|uniref:TTF-type domain-containing protein n=1 Tax=Solanum commersonii TaxID=4109 RepID=A0A9J5YJV3_SOLCO|nr:hypothetical protein H5410_031322 [Solanum commersonii]